MSLEHEAILDHEAIKKIIPHRYPFLLVDRILSLQPGVKAVGLKNVSANEPYFAGHFPEYAVMPGVLIVEALAQVGAAAALSVPENRDKLAFFAGIDKFRFRRPVRPGDTLTLTVELTRMRGPVGRGQGLAQVDGQEVAGGQLLFAIQDPTSS